jgi:hypothetical protein
MRMAKRPTATNTAIAKTARAMRMWDLPFVETATFWFGFGAVVFGVITAALTVLAFVYQVRLSGLKDEEYAKFQDESRLGIVSAEARASEAKERVLILEVESAKQQERAASAELELAKVKKRQAPRRIVGGDRDKLRALSRASIEAITFMYEPGDEEAADLARTLHMAMMGVGFPAALPIQIPAGLYRESLRSMGSMYLDAVAPTPFLRIGSKEPGGITIISRDGEADVTVKLLKETVESFGLDVNVGETDSTMGAHDFLVVVGPKP